MFSKKATKIDEIFTVDLMVTKYIQIDSEDFVNFFGLLRKRELYKTKYFSCKSSDPKYNHEAMMRIVIIISHTLYIYQNTLKYDREPILGPNAGV